MREIKKSSISLNTSGRMMRPKQKRELALALYKEYGWGYGRISKAIGDKNKSNAQRWIAAYRRNNSPDASEGGNVCLPVLRSICSSFEKALKRIQLIKGALSGIDEDSLMAEADRLKYVSGELQSIISSLGK